MPRSAKVLAGLFALRYSSYMHCALAETKQTRQIMNKIEQREVNKVEAFAAIEPAYAARMLAPLMRAASKKSLAEMVEVMDKHNLRQYMTVVNGCFVAN
jgi:hypothetical protein